MNKHFIFAYILTAVFLFSIAGVIVYQQRQINSLISQSSTKKATGILIIPSTSPKASPAPMLDPMSQWKTYTNTKDGYSIRYPKSWTLYNTPVESGTPTIESDIESWAVSGAENVSSINYSISFEVIPNNFDTWLINQGKDFKDHFKYSKSVINGYNAYTTTSLPDMLNNLSILIENKNILIKITLTPYDPAKSSEIPVKHIFDQILSTFKFTNSKTTIDISGWKKYTFDPIHLSLSVPQNLIVHQEESSPGNDFTAYVQNFAYNSPYPQNNAYQLYLIWQSLPSISQSSFTQLKDDLVTDSIETTSISGYQAIKGQIKGQRNRFVTYILVNSSKISIFTSDPTTSNKELTDQILSTFKFTQ